MSARYGAAMTLPDGFTVTTARGSDRNRGRTTVTGPDGTRVSWYEGGDVRVFRPEHKIETYGEFDQDNELGRGGVVNMRFVPLD